MRRIISLSLVAVFLFVYNTDVVEAKPKKNLIRKPSAPEIVAIASSPIKNGRVNLTFTITIPLNKSGASISGSRITTKGAKCLMRGSITKCKIKNIKVGRKLKVYAQSKNKKGYSKKSSVISFTTGSGSWIKSNPISLTDEPAHLSESRSTPFSVCTISGTASDETLYGTEGPDVICGNGGYDTIYGLGGNDLIYSLNDLESMSRQSVGNSQVGTLSVDDKHDVIYAGSGDDQIYGSRQRDVIIGGPGRDSIFPSEIQDYCRVDGDDLLYTNCLSTYSELRDQKIKAQVDFSAYRQESKFTFINNGSTWQQVNYQIMRWAYDGRPSIGWGGGINWLGPGQTAIFLDYWDAENEFITFVYDDGSTERVPAIETIDVSLDSLQYLGASRFHWDQESNPRVEHEIDGNLEFTFNAPAYDENCQCSFATVAIENKGSESGEITALVQAFDNSGFVVASGLIQGFDPRIATFNTDPGALTISGHSTVEAFVRYFQSEASTSVSSDVSFASIH